MTLEAFARIPRMVALDRAREAIDRAGGYLEDVHLYSDHLAALIAVLPEGAQLSAEGIDFAVHRIDTPETRVQIALHFPGGTGELRHVKPAVPG